MLCFGFSLWSYHAQTDSLGNSKQKQSYRGSRPVCPLCTLYSTVPARSSSCLQEIWYDMIWYDMICLWRPKNQYIETRLVFVLLHQNSGVIFYSSFCCSTDEGVLANKKNVTYLYETLYRKHGGQIRHVNWVWCFFSAQTCMCTLSFLVVRAALANKMKVENIDK